MIEHIELFVLQNWKIASIFEFFVVFVDKIDAVAALFMVFLHNLIELEISGVEWIVDIGLVLFVPE